MTKSETVRSRRPREHLTEAEIEKLMAVAKQSGRYGHRDATAILLAYRHGLRASELVGLQWDQIDFVQKTIRVRRVKIQVLGARLTPRRSPQEAPPQRLELAQ